MHQALCIGPCGARPGDHPVVARHLAFPLNLTQDPDGHGVHGKYPAQNAQGKISPVVIPRKMSRLMQHHVLTFRYWTTAPTWTPAARWPGGGNLPPSVTASRKTPARPRAQATMKEPRDPFVVLLVKLDAAHVNIATARSGRYARAVSRPKPTNSTQGQTAPGLGSGCTHSKCCPAALAAGIRTKTVSTTPLEWTVAILSRVARYHFPNRGMVAAIRPPASRTRPRIGLRRADRRGNRTAAPEQGKAMAARLPEPC